MSNAANKCMNCKFFKKNKHYFDTLTPLPGEPPYICTKSVEEEQEIEDCESFERKEQ